MARKYALNNSYFKNRKPGDPATPFEVVNYFLETGELPFKYNGDNWLYDTFVEYQKRAGVHNSQFFTPETTAERMAELADIHFDSTGYTGYGMASPYVLDACCGYGALSIALREKGFIPHGFDNDSRFKEIYEHFAEGEFTTCDFEDVKETGINIVSNPPYERNVLTAFFEKLSEIMNNENKAILLLPFGFIDKKFPKNTLDALAKFEIIYREPMAEEFARTKTRAEIVVIKKQKKEENNLFL